MARYHNLYVLWYNVMNNVTHSNDKIVVQIYIVKTSFQNNACDKFRLWNYK